MTTKLTDLAEIQNAVHQLAKEKGWYNPPKTFGEEIVMVHSELSEAIEEYRAGHPATEIYVKDGKLEGVPIELADAVIRILDICGNHGIDLVDAINRKHEYNSTRTIRHGNKKI